MQINRLKQALGAGRPVFGLFCSTPAPLVVELVGCAGFDFIIIDTEHTLVNPETLEHMLRAAQLAELTALVRVGENSAGAILRALDAGAQGVVVPRVRSGAEALRAVQASRYYPEGERGLNAGRAVRFGALDLPAAVEQMNKQIMVAPMIEDRQGVEALEEILSVAGVDLIIEGAADLSQSLGVPWRTRHPSVREELHRIQEHSHARGVPFCAVPREAADISLWWQRGVRAFVLGDERGIAFRALQGQLRLYRQALQEAGVSEGRL